MKPKRISIMVPAWAAESLVALARGLCITNKQPPESSAVFCCAYYSGGPIDDPEGNGAAIVQPNKQSPIHAFVACGMGAGSALRVGSTTADDAVRRGVASGAISADQGESMRASAKLYMARAMEACAFSSTGVAVTGDTADQVIARATSKADQDGADKRDGWGLP